MYNIDYGFFLRKLEFVQHMGRSGSIVLLVCILGLGVTAFGDSSNQFNVKSEFCNVRFYGRVSFEKRDFATDVITAYAHLAGSDKNLYTSTNAATFEIMKVNLWGQESLINSNRTKIYDGFDMATTQYKRSCNKVHVYYDLDKGNDGEFILK